MARGAPPGVKFLRLKNFQVTAKMLLKPTLLLTNAMGVKLPLDLEVILVPAPQPLRQSQLNGVPFLRFAPTVHCLRA